MMDVELIECMGSDLTVVNAARVSFDKRSDIFSSGDERLIKFLAEHNHWTPFGHCTLQFRIKAPIFVARQLVKHQVGLTVPDDGWPLPSTGICCSSLMCL